MVPGRPRARPRRGGGPTWVHGRGPSAREALYCQRSITPRGRAGTTDIRFSGCDDLRPAFIPLETWRNDELPSLAGDDLLVGINWSGPRLVGWDFTVQEVLNRL